MSLQYILSRLGASSGLNLTDPNQQALQVAEINAAAQELYQQYDLIGSLMAQYFHIENTEGMMISLPYWVGAVRAARLGQLNYNVGLVDFRPRFQSKMWRAKDWLSWALKGEHPLKQDITNEGPVTVTFAKPVEKTIRVTIAGETKDSAEDVETLSFVAGTTSLTTTKSFKTIT